MRPPLILAAIVGLVFLAFWARAESDPVQLTVVSGRSISAPATLRVRIRVEPDPANRVLVLTLTSSGYAARSFMQLDALSPVTHWREFQNVPVGQYAIVAEVQRFQGETWLARDSVTVTGF